MNHKLITFMWGFFALLTQGLYAQDPIFSQYYANSAYLNPALSGYNVGFGITTLYRNQWAKAGVERKGYQTTGFAAQLGYPCKSTGFATTYTHTQEGEGKLQWHRVSGGFHYVIYPKYNFHGASKYKDRYPFEVRLGASLGYNVRSIDWSGLTFSGDYDAVLGLVGSSPSPNPSSNFLGTNFVDLDVGGLFVLKGWERGNGTRLEQAQIGVAIHHFGLNKPPFSLGRNISLLSGVDYLPTRFTLHGSATYRISQGEGGKHLSYLVPITRLEIQAASANANAMRYHSLNVGGAVTYYTFYFGGYLQSRFLIPDKKNISSLITLVGWQKDIANWTYQFGISYDYNAGAAGSQLGDAWELSVNIRQNTYPLCPKGNRVRGRCPFPNAN